MVKIGAIIQARMGSSRLPGKVLMSLPFCSNTTVLAHIINRLKKVRKINSIIVATSINTSDDSIVDEVNKNKVAVYRGSEEDVLERFYQVACKDSLHTIIRLTSDNPCVDQTILQEIIDKHINTNADYTKTIGLPLGMNFEIISFPALEMAYKEATSPEEREHVTPYIIKNKTKFRQEIIDFNSNSSLTENLRLTIDYPNDYAFLSLVYQFFQNNYDFTLQDILQMLLKYPWIKEINNNNVQKRVFPTKEAEIENAIELLNTLGYTAAASALFKKEK